MKPKLTNHIGTRIEQARRQAGYTRRKLMLALSSRGIDITEATIRNWESGMTSPSADRLYAISQVLKVGIGNFFAS